MSNHKEFVRRLVDSVNDRDAEVVDEVAGGAFAELARRWVSPFERAFPDFRMTIVRLVEEDATCKLVAAHGVEDNLTRLRQLGIAIGDSR